MSVNHSEISSLIWSNIERVLKESGSGLDEIVKILCLR